MPSFYRYFHIFFSKAPIPADTFNSYIFDGNHCFRDISKDIFYVFSTPLPFHYGYFYRYFLILVKATLLPSDIDTDIYQNKLLTMSDLIATDTFHSSF